MLSYVNITIKLLYSNMKSTMSKSNLSRVFMTCTWDTESAFKIQHQCDSSGLHKYNSDVLGVYNIHSSGHNTFHTDR